MNQGIAEQIEPVYHRRLRDYAEYFRSFAREFEAIDRQVTTAQERPGKINDSVQSLRDQIAFRDDQQKKLTEDQAGFDRERTVITEYRGVLEEQWNAVRRNLSRLYRANKQIGQQAAGQLIGRGAKRLRTPPSRPISLIR